MHTEQKSTGTDPNDAQMHQMYTQTADARSPKNIQLLIHLTVQLLRHDTRQDNCIRPLPAWRDQATHMGS